MSYNFDNRHVVFILTNGFYPDIRTYKAAIYLLNRGMNVTVFCWDRKCTLPKLQKINGINVIRRHIRSEYGSGLKQIFAYIRFLVASKKYFKKNLYGFYHCVDLDSMIISLFIKKESGSNVVFDMREFYNSGTLKKISFIVNPVVKYLQKIARYVIYVNHLQTSDIKTDKIQKYVYLPNFPEIFKFNSNNNKPDIKLRIVYIGMVRRFKILQALVDECFQLKDDVDVIIHGTGVDEERIRKYTQDINYGNVTGYFDHEQIGLLYNNCDISFCVHMNDDENDRQAFPTKFYESINALCPVMVQEGTLMADFVLAHDIGICVDWAKKGSIYNAVLNIISDINILKKYQNNMAKIRDDYTWENVVKNLDIIYGSNYIMN